MKKSLYNLIKENVKDGTLPSDFALPRREEDGVKLRFADGAQDGIVMYHLTPYDFTSEDNNNIELLIKCISGGRGDDEETETLFNAFFYEHTVLSAIDRFQEYILQNKDKLNSKNLFKYGYDNMINSADINHVKFGMALMELFTINNERIKQAIRIIALSDEFTLFSLFLIRKWDNANDEIFDIAKRVRGWGKIYAVEFLEADNQEISDWLLHEGIKNNILSEYSAIACFEKANVRGRLKETLSYEDFSSIGEIIDNLIKENVVEGISELEDAKEVLLSYLKQFEKQEAKLSDYNICSSIEAYAKAKKEQDILTICRKYLESDKCRLVVQKAIREGEGLNLSRRLNINYYNNLLNCLENQFDETYVNVAYLMDNEEYVDKAIETFVSKLPLKKMQTGPAEESGFGEEFENYNKLLMIVQNLKDKPRKGELLVQTAVLSPVINNRSMALQVIEAWIEKEDTTLEKLSPQLYFAVKKAAKKEPVNELKEEMEKLI